MRVWQKYVLGLLLVPLALSLAGNAMAVKVQGRASTVVERYDSVDGETALPFHQYLQLNLSDIGTQGYSFKAYGRISDDLQNEVTVDSRLYYAYLEKRNAIEGLDFRLGRQFISTTAGASLMDGLMLNIRWADDYHVKAYGGGDVSYYDGYSNQDLVFGIEAGGFYFDDDLELNLSFLQKRQDNLVDIELVGFDATLDLTDQLYLYSETQFNTIAEAISYQLLGAKYRNAPTTFRLEYLYSLPVFSANSIYSVFAVEEYEEVLAEVTYKIRPGLQTYGRYTREIYNEFDDANVFELGIEKLRTNKCSGYLSGVIRDDDDGQSMYGVKARAAYRFLPELEAGIGAEVDVLEREIAYFTTDDQDQNETTSSRIWLFGTYDFTDKFNVEAKIERNESDLWDYYYRGRVRLNVLF